MCLKNRTGGPLRLCIRPIFHKLMLPLHVLYKNTQSILISHTFSVTSKPQALFSQNSHEHVF